ncbi:hypothetical protein KM043_007976 [Ampulex compressa]|nr:hypothetical protein KM043_007976 [Ampulex compressa]
MLAGQEKKRNAVETKISLFYEGPNRVVEYPWPSEIRTKEVTKGARWRLVRDLGGGLFRCYQKNVIYAEQERATEALSLFTCVPWAQPPSAPPPPPGQHSSVCTGERVKTDEKKKITGEIPAVPKRLRPVSPKDFGLGSPTDKALFFLSLETE